MQILDGKLVSQARQATLKPRIERFLEKAGRAPHLVVVLVGSVVASQVYVRNKEKSCADVGIKSTRIDLPETVTQSEFNTVLDRLNQDDSVDGVLVQLPLPKSLDADEINRRLLPEKDADGFTFQTLGHLWSGQKIVAPCTPQGVMSILEHYQIPIAGKTAVVVGRSMIVGKPMAYLLTEADATVTVCHSRTPNTGDFTRNADIVVVAAGKKHLLGKDDFKQGAVVIDVGMHGTGDGKGLAGDVRLGELEGWVSAATPVPGGVGPMTITTLLENTVLLAERRQGL
ncbi:MAG: bifunctional 5,10-methylenetetrahydrofolate dehydrogenase/5,10-methenyltetrahydrofolate cyclohydrolase [Bdellovibrio sp.]|jgi:methylenetetrahydrofolate dehydrogenase (NADP+)/methenyltetrahydrofolate cyclohydrolase